MGLPKIFSKKNLKKDKLFFLTLLTDQSIHSSLWQVFEERIILLSKSKVRFYNTPKEQVLQMDESLQDLGSKSEKTNEILFAFESHWVENNKISAAHEKEIKKLTDALSLKPVGFVLITQAIFQHLIKSNTFLSSILLYVGSNFLDLLVVRQGQVVGSLSVGRSQDIVSDLQEALARLEQDFAANGNKLPANIVLSSAMIDQEKLRLYQQRLFSLDWTEDFNFVQKPIVEIIAPDQLLEIVTKHYGKAVAKQKGLISDGEIGNSTDATVTSKTFLATDSLPDAASEPAHSEDSAVEQTEQAEQKQEEVQQASFGVPIKQTMAKSQGVTEDSTSSISDQAAQDERNDNLRPAEPDKFSKKQTAAARAQDDGSDPPSFQDKSSRKQKKKGAKFFKLIAIGGALVGLIVSALIYFVLLSMNYKVALEITPHTETLAQETFIVLNSEIAESDAENKLLKAAVIQEEVTGEETIQTTGVKETGEKAEGTVTIFNKTNEAKTFTSGTSLSIDDLEFELAEEVTVPAATTEETEDGEAEIKEFGREKELLVTAADIGAESNISKDTELSIDNFGENTYAAKAEEDFSGGLSREIRVVAEEDYQELLDTLEKRLLQQAQEQLNDQSDHNQHIVPTDNYQITAKEYSHEIGDEVEEVSLSLTLSLQALSYTSEDLQELAKKILLSEAPEDYVFVDDSFTHTSDLITEDQDQIGLEIEISGEARAEIKEEDLLQRLLGLSLEEAEVISREEEVIKEVAFVYSPFYTRRLFSSLPKQADRIEIKIN